MSAPVRTTDKRSMITTAFIAAEAVTGADAAAGSEAGTITVPTGERWLVRSVSVECVQGATQTPWPRLLITQGDHVLAAQSGTAAQPASTTCRHTWLPGGTTAGPTGATTAVTAQGTLPGDLVLEAGATLATNTVGIGANTNYGKLSALVHKLPV